MSQDLSQVLGNAKLYGDPHRHAVEGVASRCGVPWPHAGNSVSTTLAVSLSDRGKPLPTGKRYSLVRKTTGDGRETSSCYCGKEEWK
ncbi:hypothetical protein DPEC_G00149940 [Dallia pectoralis]|uniref:Uncharacterized protein n=1 Tax=Dallia pectoralis TaxID=75939 RepID=A0ACC2GJ53_DALPE|nr:hypothetical protein DPEC_G00149940 [Dallia pectoralis]